MAEEPIDALAMGCQDCTCDFKPMKVQRRPVGDDDVLFDLKYCGVCHTDVHASRNHMEFFQKTVYPCIPGHELAGLVTQVGKNVTKFKVGDHVGVGCMVDSCLKCKQCKLGQEQKCSKMSVNTYQSKDKFGRAGMVSPTQVTMGGYTSKMVVHERFAIMIPKSYPLKAAGPIMCAGVTMYDPLKSFGAKEGSTVGIVGLGGLGITGIKIAKALGCKVTGISRGQKQKIAFEAGAIAFVASTDPGQMAKAAKSFDLILNTIPANHDVKPYQRLLKKSGKQVLLGINEKFVGTFLAQEMTCFGAGNLAASGIGGIAATQEVIDLCDKYKIIPELKICPVSEINQIYEALDSGNDKGLRYVLDIANTLNEDAFTQCTAPPPKLDLNYKVPKCSGILCFCCKTCCCRCCC